MITAIVTSYNYARYLKECMDSVTRFCDEVFVYDDASTDESAQIAREYDCELIVGNVASGGPVLGSNMGIERCKTSHLVFVDSDDFLVKRPPENDTDYTFCNLLLTDERSRIIGTWDYSHRPLTDTLQYFRDTSEIPVPWKGVWRTDFIRSNGLVWKYWDTTKTCPDMRTAIEWCAKNPSLTFDAEPFCAFRIHEGQLSSVERDLLTQETRGLHV